MTEAHSLVLSSFRTSAYLFVLGVACACGSSEPEPELAPSAPTEVTAAPVAPEPNGPSGAGEDPAEPITPPSSAELDNMEQGELEAACFEGSSAACDRLGH